MGRLFKILVLILIVMIGSILYARYIGTMGFVTKEYSITSNNLSTSFDGIKIVHFSDIHYYRAININKINEIVDEINFINPDVVLFTGDLIDKDVILNDSNYSNLINAFSNINSKYGKYAVLGNHDVYDKDNVIDIFNKSGFKYLENNYDIIYDEDGNGIFIGGIGNVSNNLDNIDKTMEYFVKNNDISYKIIMVHEPDISDEIVSQYDVDLILAGHSHNGQIRIPVIGAVYTPEGSKKYYDEHYNIDGTELYISSGIGVSMINYRLFNKPSINFYRINKNA